MLGDVLKMNFNYIEISKKKDCTTKVKHHYRTCMKYEIIKLITAYFTNL